MKIDRHGKAKILTQAEIQLLFKDGLTLYPDPEVELSKNTYPENRPQAP